VAERCADRDSNGEGGRAMTFAHPLVLLLLVVPALLLWAIPNRPPAIAVPFDRPRGAQQRSGRWIAVLVGVFDAWPALLLAGVILLLAGPQSMQRPRDARELHNIQFCLDVSGSMMMGDRYRLAKEAIERFADAREGDAFGLTIFGSHQIRWVPLTKDLAALRNALPFANPERQPIHMSGTRIGAALRFCRDSMTAEATEGDRLVILVSDGASSDLDPESTSEIIDELREARIAVYHIHVAEDAIPDEVVDIAEETGGEAFQASDAKSLAKVFEHIDRMRPATFRTESTVPMDRFVEIALACLCLLGLHLVGLLGVRATPW
jgi:Ca-activated chloride channel family protein